jgi:hypothetical protein
LTDHGKTILVPMFGGFAGFGVYGFVVTDGKPCR